VIDRRPVFLIVSLLLTSAFAQNTADGEFRLALTGHNGQITWSAPGFKVVESSAKPGGNEIGIRGKDENGRIYFLGFLFLFSGQAPLNSAKCRDGVMEPEKRSNKSLKVITTSENPRPGGLPLDVVTYTTQDRNGKTSYMVRGFIADSAVCGDLEFYSDAPINGDDVIIKNAFSSYRLDENYAPQFKDIFAYAQVLYIRGDYKAAGPGFEAALAKLGKSTDGDAKKMVRVTTDQAGMSYGISGDVAKARAIFAKGIAEDPDYPMYYYNLACADAEEKNLAGARSNLQKAYDRKANVIPGEHIPDPTKDDSFLPYRDNKDFWGFLQSLQSRP
jgi:tetratricopeptide (TPR) repeat protein